jgi:hypothetical protein
MLAVAFLIVMLCVTMLSVTMLNVIMLSVVMVSFVAPKLMVKYFTFQQLRCNTKLDPTPQATHMYLVLKTGNAE